MGPLESMTVGGLLRELSDKTPTPGGGAIAPVVGALGAALAGMVLSYSIGKKSLAEHEPMLIGAGERLGRARTLLLLLAQEDAEAYARLNELMKLAKDDARRIKEMPDAVEGAIGAPRASLAACTDLLRLLETLVGTTNRYLKSDLAIAAALADAGARAAAWNVEINLPLIEDESRRDSLQGELGTALADAKARCASIESACRG